MNNETQTVPQNIIDLANEVGGLTKGCRFMSLTYTSKKHKETARYTVLVGFSYIALVEKSIGELEAILPTLAGVQLEAGQLVMASLQKSLAAHKAGTQNEDYTKKGMYASVRNGVSINLNDNSIQLFGMVQSKTVLVKGVYPVVNSRPMTLLKDAISKQLSVSKFREFALDPNVILSGKLNGETFECSTPVETLKDVVVSVAEVPVVSATEPVLV
jgi:hypothetical protein